MPPDLFDSLGLHRLIRELRVVLPRESRLESPDDAVLALIRGGVDALGPDVLREAAACFASHASGDGSVSTGTVLKMRRELRSILPTGAHVPDSTDLDFLEFCRRSAATKLSRVTNDAVAAEGAEMMRAHGREDGTLGLLEFRHVMQALADRYGWDGTVRAWESQPFFSGPCGPQRLERVRFPC